MSRETPTVQATRRDRTGSRYAKRLRNAGRLPAVIYGHKIDNVAISLDSKETLNLLHHGVHLLNVSIDGAANETCLVKELQFGYLGDNVIHIDLARVDLDEEVTVNVHIHFVGEPENAKKPGAVLNYDLTELEIICKASDIPDEIRIDISGMENSYNVSEVTLPAGIRTELDPETSICHISFVEEEAEGEEIEIAGTAEPEVITDRKDEEENES